jgi:hypothetical protein
MLIYKNKWFHRWAKSEGLPEKALCEAAQQMAAGLFEADLGGGLLKKRVARAGQGKSGGFRTLVATNRGDRWVFVFGFPKNARSNIDKDEQEALKKLAGHLMGLSSVEMQSAVQAGGLIEVNCDEKD